MSQEIKTEFTADADVERIKSHLDEAMVALEALADSSEGLEELRAEVKKKIDELTEKENRPWLFRVSDALWTQRRTRDDGDRIVNELHERVGRWFTGAFMCEPGAERDRILRQAVIVAQAAAKVERYWKNAEAELELRLTTMLSVFGADTGPEIASARIRTLTATHGITDAHAAWVRKRLEEQLELVRKDPGAIDEHEVARERDV